LNLTPIAPGLRDIWETIEPCFAALAGNKKSAKIFLQTVLLLSNINLLMLPVRSGRSYVLRANRSGLTTKAFSHELLSLASTSRKLPGKVVNIFTQFTKRQPNGNPFDTPLAFKGTKAHFP